MISGIYCIENKINGKKYVGQGKDVEKRMMENHRECKVLYSSIIKYGKQNFYRYVLEYCEDSILDEKESFYIKKLNSHVSGNGYNVLWGGFSRRNVKTSDETKRKISRAISGEKHPNFGKHHSEETRRKIRTKNLGKAPTFKGRKHTPESIEKIKNKIKGRTSSFLGKKHSDEAKDKNRKGHLGNKSKNASSRYSGVSRSFQLKKYTYWVACFYFGKKTIRIGTFREEVSAAIAFDLFIFYKRYDNPLNFPEKVIEYNQYFNNKNILSENELRSCIKDFIKERSKDGTL